MLVVNRLLDRHTITLDSWGYLDSTTTKTIAVSNYYLALRFFIALLVLALVQPKLVKATTFKEWRLGFATAFLFSTGILLQIIGLREIPASRSAFLTSLSVVFTPLLVMVIFKRLPRPLVVVGAAIAILGTAILTGVTEELSNSSYLASLKLGDGLTIFGALLFAFLIIQIDSISKRIPAERITPGMFLGIGALSSLAALSLIAHSNNSLQTLTTLAGDYQLLVITLFMSIFTTLIPFHLMNRYQHYFSPAHASLIYTLEPIFATAWSLFIPTTLSLIFSVNYQPEILTHSVIAGGALILLGNALAVLPFGKKDSSR